MIQQEQQPMYCLNAMPEEDLIHHLLSEHQGHPRFSHDQSLPLPDTENNNKEKDQQQPFGISILQKEESNCFMPVKFMGELAEEDQILINMPMSTASITYQSPTRKDGKNDRSSYIEESRQTKIQRYLHKKQRRIWNRKVFYDCRKLVADSRERVNGRFVKKSPLVAPNSSTQKTNPCSQLEVLKEFQLEGGGLQDCYL